MAHPQDPFVRDRLPPAAQCPIMRYDTPQLQIAPRLNLVEELFRQAEANGWAARPMLRSPAATLSYAEVRDQVARIARVLLDDCGLVSGNRVLLRGGNSVGMALAWLGVVRAGLVAVATMPLLRTKELADIIDKSKPALSLCEGRLAAELQAVPGGPPVLYFNQADDAQSLASRAATKPAGGLRTDGTSDDIALMAFTSGTTGKPKAVLHSHRDVLAACECWPRHVLQAA